MRRHPRESADFARRVASCKECFEASSAREGRPPSPELGMTARGAVD